MWLKNPTKMVMNMPKFKMVKILSWLISKIRALISLGMMLSRTCLNLMWVISCKKKLRRTWLVSKTQSRNSGTLNWRNKKMESHHLKLIAVTMTKFQNSVTLARHFIYELFSLTTIQRQSLSLVLAESNLKSMKLETFVASRNTWICQLMNGKSFPTNVWKRMKMAFLVS